jgi:hypothetical protein
MTDISVYPTSAVAKTQSTLGLGSCLSATLVLEEPFVAPVREVKARIACPVALFTTFVKF